MPYSHYRPILKQANITVQDALAALSPTDSLLKDYALYAGGGGVAGAGLGAGIGALVNALRGESKLKGALIGGGIGTVTGAGLGAGLKAFGDYSLKDIAAKIQHDKNLREDTEGQIGKGLADLAALRKNNPNRTGGGLSSTLLELWDDTLGGGTSVAEAQRKLEKTVSGHDSGLRSLDRNIKHDQNQSVWDALMGRYGIGG